MKKDIALLKAFGWVLYFLIISIITSCLAWMVLEFAGYYDKWTTISFLGQAIWVMVAIGTIVVISFVSFLVKLNVEASWIGMMKRIADRWDKLNRMYGDMLGNGRRWENNAEKPKDL